MNNRVGQLLIAHPNLPKENPFQRTVIYILNDNETGTQGIILNKPTAYKVADFMTQRGYGFPSTDQRIRFGGPLSTKTVFMLHTDDFTSASSEIVGNGLMISCDDFMIEKMTQQQVFPHRWRMCVGICGWQPGQLDMELQGHPPYRPENSWLVAKANESIMFSCDGEQQWQKAMELSSRQMINSYF